MLPEITTARIKTIESLEDGLNLWFMKNFCFSIYTFPSTDYFLQTDKGELNLT